MQRYAQCCCSLLALISILAGTAAAATSTETALASSTAQCWYPDKSTLATTDRPCNNGADGVSACCAPDNICLTNGYCIEAGLLIGRGSCTDQSWSDAACPQQCRDFNPSGGGLLVQCDSTSSPVSVACGTAGNCSKSNFSFPSYNYILRDFQVQSFGLSSAITITTSTSTGTSIPATTGSGDSPPNGNASLQSVPTASSTACASDQSLQAALHAEQQKTTAVGAGVGVPLGVLFLSFLALFLLERHKRRNTSETGISPTAGPFGGKPGAHRWNSRRSGKAELDEDRAKHELGGDAARSELPNGLNADQN